ncbi:MAG: acyl-CoA thioesterase [Clostridiaceae bacterium]|nr:acyl-CoA thioesterase [Clostridiaceae bacterium]
MIQQKTNCGFRTVFRVRYYETDAMGIVHHSNYLRWFELGRTEYLRSVGLPYRALEEQGIASPVTGIRCHYHKPARYDDEITLKVVVKAYKNTRLTMAYEIFRDELLLCSGESDHAFIYEGRPVAPRRSLPDLDKILSKCLQSDSTEV